MWKKMYMILLDGITKAIEALQAASLEAEQVYMDANDTPINLEFERHNPQGEE